MKRIFLAGAVLMICMAYHLAAYSCSVVTGMVQWPKKEQINVPLNAKVRVFCYDCSAFEISLIDIKRESPVAFDLKELDGNRRLIVPKSDLEALKEYKVVMKFKNYDYKVESKFTTGSSADNEPPAVGLDSISVDIDWAADKKEIELFPGGMCGSKEYSQEEIKEYGLQQYVKDENYLPEHYHVDLNVSAKDSGTDEIVFSVTELFDDGKEELIDTYYYGFTFFLERMNAVDIGESKRYRLQFSDAIGNVQPETIEVEINFKQDKTDYSIMDGEIIITGGGGGDGGNDGDPEESAAGGCSLNATNSANGNSIAVIATIVGLLLAILARCKRSAGCVK